MTATDCRRDRPKAAVATRDARPAAPAARPTYPEVRLAVALLLLGTVGIFGSGCSFAGLFYKHRYRSDRFVIYTDHDRDFLQRVGPKVDEIYAGYSDLFGLSPDDLGRTSIFLKGDERDEQVVDLSYSPNLLGYYIPFLNMISVDTKPAWTREPVMLDQILLHEIAHHFILTQWPAAAKECWLNEGLAGNLEMTLFSGGRFEYPLLNPTLLGIARRAVLIDHPAARLDHLLRLEWSRFHDGDTKDIHYAASWALVYFLLHEVLPPDSPLGERIRTLYRIDRDWIAAQEGRFHAFLRGFDLTGALIDLARTPRDAALGKLAPAWAIDQMGTLKFLDDARALCFLESIIDAPPSAIALRARLAFLRALRRGLDAARRCSVFERGRDRIVQILLDPSQPLSHRRALAAAAADLPRVDPWWVPILIGILDSPDGEIRAAAAQGLSEELPKPTVVNPSFWKSGDPAARRAEIDEWRAWWDVHRAGLETLD